MAPQVVLITSPKPGDGKTTVAANLAAGFAERDLDVIVLSADPHRPTIEDMLLARNATSVARQTDSTPMLTTVPGVLLVPSRDPSLRGGTVEHERQSLRRARARSNIVVIDTPPMLATNDAADLMRDVDSTVLVARLGRTTAASARRAGEMLARLGLRAVGVVLVDVKAAPHAAPPYTRRNGTRRPARTAGNDCDTTTAPSIAPRIQTYKRSNGGTSSPPAEPSRSDRTPRSE
jgi:Mrp family chromosome partitioning ATPase